MRAGVQLPGLSTPHPLGLLLDNKAPPSQLATHPWLPRPNSRLKIELRLPPIRFNVVQMTLWKFSKFAASPTLKAAALVVALLRCFAAPANAANPTKVSFVNDVIPVLTKAGCNSGPCHAKAGAGQNGFQLSLLGFEPEEDYERLVKEGRIRRLSPAAPDRSLLLLKASAGVPHGGGKRLAKDSAGYRALRQWIALGMPPDDQNSPKLARLEVLPGRQTTPIGSTHQLQALAHYSDGSHRDISHLALFESNDRGMAEVSEDGIVQISSTPGKVAVMVRFLDQVAVFNAVVPLGAPVKELPPAKNFIDGHVLANLKEIGIPPSPVCDDATFLRRATLDIAGRLPTDKEAAAFASSEDPNKRDTLIDRLLQDPGYADFFANKWTAMLKNRRDDKNDITSNFAFHSWMRDSLLSNKPYNQLVRELLAATGTVMGNPPVAWYKRVKDPKTQIEDVAQLFLGVRMQCAQCHHHPFERWSQDDYYSLTAFFSQIGRKPTAQRGEDMIYHKRGIAVAKNVRTGKELKPAALGDPTPDIGPDEDPRLRLADWMGRDNNPFFAKALVNRYWKHFFKRGLIEPEDDIRDSNPPTNPELLAALERHFVESGFDLKELVRAITQSTAYQLSAIPNEHNIVDQQNYSRYYPKRMQAETMLDSIDDLTLNRTSFANLPVGTRAIALPDNSYNKASPFLRVFGRPDSSSVCECERVQSASLSQSLHLMNDASLKKKLSAGSGRAAQLAKNKKSDDENIRELYLAAFARQPKPNELKIAKAFLAAPRTDAQGKPLADAKARQQKYEDLIWALINTKEFLFNH